MISYYLKQEGGEVSTANKDSHTVMAAQKDLVELLAKFELGIVRMVDAKESQED